MSDVFSSNIELYAITDLGRVRKNNEDAVLAFPTEGCFIVSDGMGGGKAGEVASAMMVNEVEKVFSSLQGSRATPGEREGLLIRAAYRVNYLIREYADKHGYSSMGATLVALVLDSWRTDTASVFHAGDSRAYRIRNDKIEQLMEDHSVAASSKVPENKIAPMFRGVLTNALGTGDDFFLERTAIDILENDIFILCSDGLTRMVPDSELLQIYCMTRHDTMKALCKALLEAALDRGGKDNISIIALRIKKCGSSYEPSELEAKRDSDAQMRNLMDLTDTSKTEIACDISRFKNGKDGEG